MPYSEIPVLEGFGLFDYKPTSRGAGNHVQVIQLNHPWASGHQDSRGGPGGLLEWPCECLLKQPGDRLAFLASLTGGDAG